MYNSTVLMLRDLPTYKYVCTLYNCMCVYIYRIIENHIYRVTNFCFIIFNAKPNNIRYSRKGSSSTFPKLLILGAHIYVCV